MGQNWDVTNLKGLMTFMQTIPSEIKTLQFLAFVMIVADTITGVIRAIIVKEVSSKKMRVKLLSRGACYFGFVILGAIATVIGKTWVMLESSYYAIMAVETTSMLENITIISRAGGINLGPANKLMNYLATIFEAAQQANLTTNVVSQTTVIPQNPKEGPIITTTNVEQFTRPKSLPEEPKGN